MIALFDSGIGGLTVLKPILERLPQYDYFYLGDCARSPYGSKSKQTLTNFSIQAVDYLFDRGATLIIFACNTVSAATLREIQSRYLKGKEEKERKILGVLVPVAEEISKLPANTQIGLLGTETTINSKSYEREIFKRNPNIKIRSQACPLLVPLIENNWQEKPKLESILKDYLKSLKSDNVESIVLACTHYPVVKEHFEKIMGDNVNIYDAGDTTAKALEKYLQNHPEIESKLSRKQTRTILTTGSTQKMDSFLEKYFKTRKLRSSKVEL